MIVRDRESGIRVTEKRLEGITVAYELKSMYPKAVGSPWNRRVEPKYQISTPDHLYGYIGNLQISTDKKHLVCEGWYDEWVDLIRDDEVLLSGKYQHFSIESASERDFSRLAVISTDYNGKKAFHFIDRKGLRFTCLEGETNIRLDRTNNGLNHFLLVTADGEDKKAAHFVDEMGNVRTALEGSEEIVLEEDNDGIYGLLSSVKDGVRKFAVFDWAGNEYLSFDVAGIERYGHLNDFHLSQILVFAKTEEGGKIVQNGETLYEDALEPDFYTSSLNTDGTFGAVTLCGPKRADGESGNNDNDYFIFCITPKGAFLYEQPFDKVMSVRTYNDGIVAEIIKNGVSRTVTVTAPQEQNISQLTPDV